MDALAFSELENQGSYLAAESSQIVLVFDLHQAPVISELQRIDHRTILAGPGIQLVAQPLAIPLQGSSALAPRLG